MHPRRAAFTFIELIVVITMMAILATILAVSFQNLRLSSRFNDQKVKIVSLIEGARSQALSNILVNGTAPTSYYLLDIESTAITLTAVAEDATSETLKTLTLDSDMTLATVPLEIYYFPPYGDVCFDSACADTTTISKDFTLSDSTGAKTATFTLNVNGGYVDVN